MPPPLPLHRLTPDSPDRELLERYVRERDEQAFAALVARHGRMVKGPFGETLGRLRLAVVLAKDGKVDEAKKEIARAEKLVGPFGDGFRSAGNRRLGPEFARAWVAAGEAADQKAVAEKLAEPYQRAYRLLTLAKGFRKPTPTERDW